MNVVLLVLAQATAADDWTRLITSALVGLASAAVVALIQTRKSPSRTTTESVVLLDAQGNVVTTLNEELHRVNRRNDELEAENEALQEANDTLNARIRRLEKALRDLGVDPEPMRGA